MTPEFSEDLNSKIVCPFTVSTEVTVCITVHREGANNVKLITLAYISHFPQMILQTHIQSFFQRLLHKFASIHQNQTLATNLGHQTFHLLLLSQSLKPQLRHLVLQVGPLRLFLDD